MVKISQPRLTRTVGWKNKAFSEFHWGALNSAAQILELLCFEEGPLHEGGRNGLRTGSWQKVRRLGWFKFAVALARTCSAKTRCSRSSTTCNKRCEQLSSLSSKCSTECQALWCKWLCSMLKSRTRRSVQTSTIWKTTKPCKKWRTSNPWFRTKTFHWPRSLLDSLNCQAWANQSKSKK